MKKVTLALGLILATLFGFSQDLKKLSTYKSIVGHLNAQTKEYEYGRFYYGHITFTFNGDYIITDDNAHSIYRVIERIPEYIENGFKVISAKCTDEKNIECTFAIKIPAECAASSIGVIYNDLIYVYIIEQE